ncbi:unnamed protein product [Schistosoma intercalatum]|nr:unnamed protein product [Schistosoma intercalatum]CAH8497344.1 unnamed protein product [Schistosoma intercalatum]
MVISSQASVCTNLAVTLVALNRLLLNFVVLFSLRGAKVYVNSVTRLNTGLQCFEDYWYTGFDYCYCYSPILDS